MSWVNLLLHKVRAKYNTFDLIYDLQYNEFSRCHNCKFARWHLRNNQMQRNTHTKAAIFHFEVVIIKNNVELPLRKRSNGLHYLINGTNCK